MGANGSLVGSTDDGALWRVPAYAQARVVDPTGCGNAYMGGLMAGLLEGKALAHAAAWGAAAASCMLEAQGMPLDAPRLVHAQAAGRQHAVLQEVELC